MTALQHEIAQEIYNNVQQETSQEAPADGEVIDADYEVSEEAE